MHTWSNPANGHYKTKEQAKRISLRLTENTPVRERTGPVEYNDVIQYNEMEVIVYEKGAMERGHQEVHGSNHWIINVNKQFMTRNIETVWTTLGHDNSCHISLQSWNKHEGFMQMSCDNNNCYLFLHIEHEALMPYGSWWLQWLSCSFHLALQVDVLVFCCCTTVVYSSFLQLPTAQVLFISPLQLYKGIFEMHVMTIITPFSKYFRSHLVSVMQKYQRKCRLKIVKLVIGNAIEYICIITAAS